MRKKRENAILVGVEIKGEKSNWTIHESLSELKELAKTAGAEVLDKIYQVKDRPDGGYYIGKGKLEELKQLVELWESDLIIFDNDISPRQQKNLEEELNIKVIDRTQLILDIFASRAQTREAQVQVKLAQLEYIYPRLTGLWTHFSRLGGGIGTRGPGETQLEVDRRLVKDKIVDLKKKMNDVRKARHLHQQERANKFLVTGTIVGYTNSGKSTLLNALTGASVSSENKLFATLDPTVRKMMLEKNQEVLLCDTVGFIQKLPHHLFSSFKATLEGVNEADFLIHVVDSSCQDPIKQIKAVENVLGELNAQDKLTITVFNKIDLIRGQSPKVPVPLKRLMEEYKPSLMISALEGINLEGLKEKIKEIIHKERVVRKFKFPYSEMNKVSFLHKRSTIIEEKYHGKNVYITAVVDPILGKRFEEFIVGL